MVYEGIERIERVLGTADTDGIAEECPGVRGYEGTRSGGTRVRGYEGTGVRGYEGTRVRGYEGTRIRGYEGTRVRGYEGTSYISTIECRYVEVGTYHFLLI